MKRLIVSAAITLSIWGQTAEKPVDLEISADKVWTDTGVDVSPGEMIGVEASGTASYMGRETGPAGLIRGWADMIKTFPLNDAKRGALIGRIGAWLFPVLHSVKMAQ